MRQLVFFTIAATVALFSGSLLTFAAYAAPPLTSQAVTPAITHSQTATPTEAISSTETLTGTGLLTGTSVLTDARLISVTAALSDVIDGSALATDAISATQVLTGTDVITETAPITEAVPITVTATPSETDGTEQDQAEDDAATAAALDAQYAEIIEGAILANRTDLPVRFFLEGETYLLDPLRSLGIDLSRATAVMNLYNCDASTPESDETCYWDPYLLDEDGFYEIVTGVEEGLTVELTLREAGAPANSQVWIQNRTGKREIVVYKDVTYEIPPSSVEEFSVEADALPTFFLRSCVDVNGQAACEWTPVVVDPGFYYALTEKVTAGGLPGSTVVVLALESIVGDGVAADSPVNASAVDETTMNDADTTADGTTNDDTVSSTATAETTPTSTSTQLVCTLQVPALNVRSGPGLEYEIVAKVRGDDVEAPTVLVEGRDNTGLWLAVSELVASGGWITGNANYILCESDTGLLPVAEITDGRLAPTPVPVAGADTGDDGAAAVADPVLAGDEAVAETTAPTPNIPEGLAMLIVNNGFDRDIRFTLDQKHRPEPGPSETDLKPGESVSILVYPGIVPFSASSPWNGLGDNAEIELVPDTSLPLWLFFMPDPDGSGEWILQF